MSLFLFNTLSKKKESFEPISPPFVGMYVCGPTVYGDPHLGHARSAITFDIVFRYLLWLGYRVRYVRNITDVGHLENDADTGEDKIAKKARVEQIEPMEVAQYYTNRYHGFMDKLNVKRPSIEPHASGHIIEQIEMIEQIIKAGYAYLSEGSVYFDVVKYNQTHNYGILSGRIIDELLSNTRENLGGQDEKRNFVDFALWKKASPEHIMRWKSPWGDGFPGWHLECSAMGKKYLGETFDIHGGGMDLIFPHHESEIAQSCVANAGMSPVKYWLHNNMITINGQKMGKSLGNAVALEEFFTGNHTLLTQAYSPMTIRFFILQAHYRSTLDFSNEALQASEKGLKKLLEAKKTLNALKGLSGEVSEDVVKINKAVFDAMNDDFNTAIAISHLFDAVRIINTANASLNKVFLTDGDINMLKKLFNDFLADVLGIEDEQSTGSSGVLVGVMNMILDIRQQAKANKDYALSDEIRNKLSTIGISIKDGKDEAEWTVN